MWRVNSAAAKSHVRAYSKGDFPVSQCLGLLVPLHGGFGKDVDEGRVRVNFQDNEAIIFEFETAE